MEKPVNIWKANLTNGLILGLIGVVYTLVIYFLDLIFNNVQGYIFLLILIVTLFYLVKSYRDNYLHGYMDYGKAVGSGVIIFLYYAIISAIFTYLLYKVIDTGLVAKSLASSEEVMVKKGFSQDVIDAGMKFQKKIMKPEIMVLMGLFVNMLTGTIMSLIVGIFVKKEGNPLVDPQEIK